jgi:site-specific recombinase XerD
MGGRCPVKYLLENEERGLLKTLRDSKSATRDRHIIELVLNTGLRVQEVRLLNVGDIFNGMVIRDHLTVRAETAKRCKAREIFLNSHVSKVLKAFISFKRERGESLDPYSPLFISKKGGRVGQRTLQDMAEKWFVKAGLVDSQGAAKFTFHSLRHTFAMKLRRRGVSLERVQKLLGHASLQATGIYVEPSREDLIEAVSVLAA